MTTTFTLSPVELACGVTMDDVRAHRAAGYVTASGLFVADPLASPAVAGAAARMALGGPVEFSHVSAGCAVYLRAGA